MTIKLITKCAHEHVELVEPAAEDGERAVFGSAADFCQRCEEPLMRRNRVEEPCIEIRPSGFGFSVRFYVPRTPVQIREFAQRTEMMSAIRGFARRVLGPQAGTDAAMIVEDQ